MRIWIFSWAVMLAGATSAQEYEIEFSFYMQPDSSGSNTENRSIKLEEGELELEAHNAVEEVYIERDATAEEIDYLVALARTQFTEIEFVAGPRIDPPYVEVEVAFDGNNVSMELEYEFARGDVPDMFVDLQKRFFAGAFR